MKETIHFIHTNHTLHLAMQQETNALMIEISSIKQRQPYSPSAARTRATDISLIAVIGLLCMCSTFIGASDITMIRHVI